MNTVNTDNFNETMKGYIIRACRIIEYDSKHLDKILNGLRWSIDEMTMEDARKEYGKYRSGKIQFK
ncbi:hypothetical protein GKZ28_13075 [Clostridium chromiireducens]|uniref:Uncharacterized protein n=1 Tax=Clostridium chromiireducens TaxID=225345 RepID=A0A964RN81_9CLOT|nr:hypothetical protein [Clostridium chromiireducens]MVX64625.1 hypothetical protein [Clostridium chromiireducens]